MTFTHSPLSLVCVFLAHISYYIDEIPFCKITMRLIFLLFGGAIATTSVLGLAVLSYIAQASSASLEFIASCAPSEPDSGRSTSQEPSPTPSPSPTPRQS